MKRTRTLGPLALTIAAAGAFLLVLRVTETFGRGSIFCSDTSCAVEAVLWTLPWHAAMLTILVVDILVTSTLMLASVGPSGVRLTAILAAVAGAVSYIIATVVTLDVAWAGAFSGQLSARPTPLMPPTLITLTPALWTLSLMLTGISVALISLLLLPLRVPLSLVMLGWIAGVGLVALIPLTAYARTYGVDTYAFPVVFLALTVWALYLAIVLMNQTALRL